MRTAILFLVLAFVVGVFGAGTVEKYVLREDTHK